MNCEKLRFFAEKRGFSIEELAKETGIDVRALEKKLSGDREFLLWEIKRLVKILFLKKSDVRDIFFDEKVSFRKQNGRAVRK